jgi:orotidine-5'-phosphate decarboxylase
LKIAAKKLIIALDDLDFAAALKFVQLTKSFAATFKVGLSLFSAYGPKIVYEIKALGVDVFLDLKLHDIPMQVKKAVENILPLAPRFLTIHALGGRAMLEESVKMVQGSPTTLLAVSILTSLDHNDYRELGFNDNIEHGVMNLSNLAFLSGIRGLVVSPHEVAQLRARYKNNCYLVCPGVRPLGSDNNDQSRIMTPKEAIIAGADALVVGRPLTKATHVLEVLQHIHQEIEDVMQHELWSERVVSQ